jgi:hypothetical protein
MLGLQLVVVLMKRGRFVDQIGNPTARMYQHFGSKCGGGGTDEGRRGDILLIGFATLVLNLSALR